ncbi:hypothetical protein ScPMuIL_016661 [Solemya velum]
MGGMRACHFSRLYKRNLIGRCFSHSEVDIQSTDEIKHKPVLVQEVVDLFQPKSDQLIVDMTFGGGGHTKALLNEAPGLKIIALDRDHTAYNLAQNLAQSLRLGTVTPLLGRFSELPRLLSAIGVGEGSVDGVLFDLGASSMQYDQPSRGFSLSRDGPLDMRMNNLSDGTTAADVVNSLDEVDLYHIIKTYGEERNARLIAHAIIQARYHTGGIRTTHQLASIVSSVFTGVHRRDKIMRKSHVATKTFQALRIFVNNELNEINSGMECAYDYLKPGGRCIALSFHSLEDRIIKRQFHEIDMDSKWNKSVRDQYRMRNAAVTYESQEIDHLLDKKWIPISKKVIVPNIYSISENPRARSAKLRAAIKKI